MKESGKTIFREKNLKEASEPEQFDNFLRVTGFGPWLTLLSAALVLAAVFVWVFFGRFQTVITGAGYCKDGRLLCYVSQKELDGITDNTTVDVEGTAGEIIRFDPSLYTASDISNDVLFLLPDTRWYCMVVLDCPLEDGLYKVSFYRESVAPVSFMTQGGENQ